MPNRSKCPLNVKLCNKTFEKLNKLYLYQPIINISKYFCYLVGVVLRWDQDISVLGLVKISESATRSSLGMQIPIPRQNQT